MVTGATNADEQAKEKRIGPISGCNVILVMDGATCE
jgi:hypothetical protein